MYDLVRHRALLGTRKGGTPEQHNNTDEPQQPSKGKMVRYNVYMWCDSMCRTFWKGENYRDRRPIGEQED